MRLRNGAFGSWIRWVQVCLACGVVFPALGQNSLEGYEDQQPWKKLVRAAESEGENYSMSGVYITPWGAEIHWTSSSSYQRWSSRTGWSSERPEGERVLIGQDAELESIGVEESEHPNGRLVYYEPLRRARDLMRGQIWPRPELGVHSCDNPVCAYEVDARKPHPFRRKTAQWAIWSYVRYLEENPDDWAVMRELAVALALLDDLSDGVEVMRMVYTSMPELGSEPIDAVFLGIDSGTIRALVAESVQAAHRDPSAEGWLLVAVLMQCEGRLGLASEMLDRAEDLGLDEGVVQGLRKVLP